MLGELVFTVRSGEADRARPITLAEAGLRERDDLQEWVRLNPDVLGDDIRIVTFEFNAWQSRRGNEADRLDLLGIDTEGRLVVIELKRGMAPDTVEMQAIKYAAYASRFTPDTLAESHAAYLSKSTTAATSADDALDLLEQHAGGNLDVEMLRRPRIILMAGGFPEQLTAAAVWLTEMGLDLTLIQFGAYQAAHDIVLTVSQVWPLPDVEEFTVSPRRAEIKAADDRTRRQRETNAVVKLIADGVLDDGVELRFNVAAVSPSDQQAVEAWIADDPRRGRARWTNNGQAPLGWGVDGSAWSPTGLTREIVQRATGRPPHLAGPRFWVDDDGTTLAALAGFRSRRRDWSQLHRLMEQVHPGEWTTYGDLAEAIGSRARPVGQHILRCSVCPNAQRVLTSDGTVAANFVWADITEQRDPRALLESEGLSFASGAASASGRVDARTLTDRLSQVVG